MTACCAVATPHRPRRASRLHSLDELQRRLNYKSIPAADIADNPAAARQPFVGEDDVLNTAATVGSLAGCVGAIALAFYLVSRGTAPLAVGLFSVLSGLVIGGAALLLVRRRLRRERALGLEKLSEAQGLLIWVRVRSPEKEAEAQEILTRHGGEAVADGVLEIILVNLEVAGDRLEHLEP